jgi:opacity protein-like surface antigen
MHKLLLTAVAAGAVIASLGSANAADFPQYPPQVVAPPPLIPLEVVSGWYLRGDIGYKIYGDPEGEYENAAFGFAVPGNGEFFDESLDDTFAVGVGVGYQFNEFLRSDLTLDYEFNSDFEGGLVCGGPCGGPGFSVEHADISAWTGLVNAYVDLGTYAGLTPYLGAGIGASYLRTSDVYSDQPDGTRAERDGDSQWNFAWALMAGAGYQFTDSLVLDLNYRYLNLGDAVAGSVGGEPVEINNIDAHEIRVGLRYMLQ